MKRKNDETTIESVERVSSIPIEDELVNNFTEYAEEVNLHRAFPYVASGLKPVAGHILWSMWRNKRTHKNPYTKSAKITGEVMSFSPHGDAYGSMVRMAQDFTYHIPYIDGHGSFGSVIGGPTPGASRYTEMRMSEFIEDVLFYNTDILDMGLNYLEEEPEPIFDTWVALLPLLFMTNTSGMGYTSSNTWSSCNLKEFRDQVKLYLKTGKVDCSKLFPDFPTGGIITNQSEMADLYKTGKGTIKLRGKAEIDGDTIQILSLPYQIYPEQFMEDLKKYVTSSTTSIIDVSNRCDKKGFLIEVECEKGTAEYTLEMLYKKTCLQTNIANEFKAVVGNRPVMVNLQSYMEMFVKNNIELVIKEATYNLTKIMSRLEIVEGLLNALDIIDDIIATIKSAKSMDDAKNILMTKKIKGIKFTENQADAIVHTPLGRLANLEQIKLRDEKKDLEKQKAENETLQTDKKAQEKYFYNRFSKLVDKYGWDRKTELADIELKDIKVAVEKPESLKRPKKEFMVVLTNTNCLKRIEVAKFRQTDEDNKCIKVQGNQKVVLVSNKGIMYKVFSNAIDKCLPNASGTPIPSIRTLQNENEQIIAIYSENVDLPYIYFLTKNGLGKKCDVSTTLNISKTSGAVVCGFKSDDDEIMAVKLLNDGDKIEVITNQRTEVIEPGNIQGRGAAGKKVIYLKKDEVITEVHSK